MVEIKLNHPLIYINNQEMASDFVHRPILIY